MSPRDESLIEQADVMIDFSSPAASISNAEICAEFGTALVIGTTGIDSEQEDGLRNWAKKVPIFMSPNMSVGMSMLYRLVESAVSTLGRDFDVEIFEAHHSGKKDAPSGTALRLGEAVAAARAVDLQEKAVFGRIGDTRSREPGSIGFSSMRGGDIAGDHMVILAGDGERLELTPTGHMTGEILFTARFWRPFCLRQSTGSVWHERFAWQIKCFLQEITDFLN